MDNLFEKVLFIGPDKSSMGKGGISSVMRLYSQNIIPFNYLRTNSANGTIPGVFALFFALIKLPYYRWFKSIQIAHIHSAAGKSFIRKSFIIKWAKLLGFKIVFHCHSGYFKDLVDKKGRNKVNKILDKCEAIVTLSEMWKNYFEEELGYKNVYIINNIVSPMDSNTKNVSSNKLRLLFLGLICDNKGIFDLLEVIVSHKKEFENNLTLYIGGVGETERMNDIISKHKLNRIVKPMGWVAGEAKISLMNNCDVCILPSYVEGLPITILEAMANAKAIIASNVGGIPEIVEDGKSGILHSPGDKDAIYCAIKHFIDTPSDIESFGFVGKNKVTGFYPEAVKESLIRLYSKILTSKNNFEIHAI